MELQRGINLGGWLSQCDYSRDRMDTFITEPDFKTIAGWGLDHVRLPVDCDILESGDGFRRIETAIERAGKYGLDLVLDLHKAPGYSFGEGSAARQGLFTAEDFQAQFYEIWEDLARRFGPYSERVAFELLNEVTDKEVGPVWSRIARETIRRIRQYAPDTRIIVGSYWYNSAAAVPDLDPPYDDNIIYNMHCYEPMKFTHQCAPWCDAVEQGKLCSFTESGVTEETFEKLFAPAIEKAKRESVPLYCGEYGVIENASPEDALEWYRRINAVFRSHGIGRAAWTYRQMDFGISDPRMDGVREELIKYL